MKPQRILAVLLFLPLTTFAGPDLTMTKTQFESAQKQKLYRFDGYPTKNTFNGKTAKLNMKDQYARTFRTRLREVLAENLATKKILYKVNPINFLDYALDFLVKWYISPKQSMANPPKNTS